MPFYRELGVKKFFFSTPLEDKTQLIVVNRLESGTEQMFNGRVTLPPPAEPKTKKKKK